MLLVLAGLALTLSGCGGSDKKVNTSPAKLVSQTVTGDWTGHASSGLSADFTAQVTAHFDADLLNVRIDGQATSQGLNITKPQIFSLIVHAGKKTATLHLQTTIPLPFPTCVYKTVDAVPPVEIMRSLLKDKIENQKPNGMDGDYRQWTFDLPEIQGASGHAYVDVDDDNGLRKGYESVKLDTNASHAGATTTFTASDVKLGKPDGSLFEPPKEWGTCVEVPNMTAPAFKRLPQHLQLAAALFKHAPVAAPKRPTAGEALLVV